MMHKELTAVPFRWDYLLNKTDFEHVFGFAGHLLIVFLNVQMIFVVHVTCLHNIATTHPTHTRPPHEVHSASCAILGYGTSV